MSYLKLLFVLLLFPVFVNAQSEVPEGDFVVFPLSTGNVALLEGVWRSDAVDIEIEDSGFRWDERPVMWVQIRDYKQDDTRRGLMYYDSGEEKYSLYVWGTSTTIPIDLGILKFSSSYASQFGLSCASGGALLKISFVVDADMGELVLTKESCDP